MVKKVYFNIRSDAAWVAVIVGALVAWFVVGLVTGHGDTLASMSSAVDQVTYALVLGASAAFYCHWRLTDTDQVEGLNPRLTGWLVMGMAMAALPQLLVPRRGTYGDAPTDADSWLLLSQGAIVLLLVLVTRVSQRLDVPSDPIFVGVVAGLLVSAGARVTSAAGPDLGLDPQTTAFGAALVLCGLLLASTLLQQTHVSVRIRRRLAVGAIALVVAQAAGHQPGTVAASIAVVFNVLGALTLCATALRLLRDTLLEYREEVALMHSTLREQEVKVLEQRELLHELGSTIAGIASAAEIIRQKPHLPELRRRRLESMLDAEVTRMMRLMGDRSPVPVIRDLDVDDVVGTLVLSHQTRGQDIRWRPSGLTAIGSADDLAEVMNILLENAARHAAGAPVSVAATMCGDTVQIVCSDLGPGVPPEMRSRLFEAGVRGPKSPGHGLGLSIARRILAAQRGSLLFRQTPRGATFVVRIPAQVGVQGARHDVVHAS